MSEVRLPFEPLKPDAVFSLEGTLFNHALLPECLKALSQEGVISSPHAFIDEQPAWDDITTDTNHQLYTSRMINFFSEEILGKSRSNLESVSYRFGETSNCSTASITLEIVDYLKSTHNIIYVATMPEKLIRATVKTLGCTALLGCLQIESINDKVTGVKNMSKSEVYERFRGEHGIKQLDVVIGDHMDDAPLLHQARRPILFNPSWELSSHRASQFITTLTTHKDVLSLINRDYTGQLVAKNYSRPFNISQILEQVEVAYP